MKIGLPAVSCLGRKARGGIDENITGLSCCGAKVKAKGSHTLIGRDGDNASQRKNSRPDLKGKEKKDFMEFALCIRPDRATPVAQKYDGRRGARLYSRHITS